MKPLTIRKLTFSFLLCTFSSLQLLAQTGPGGLNSTDAPTQLWLRADQGISEVNGQIQTWADQSGNGRNFSQANASQRPSLKPSALNGRPTVDFNAASGTNLAGPNTNVFFGLNANKPTEITDFIIVFQQPISNTADVINFPRVSGSSFTAFVSNGGDGNPRSNNDNDVKTFVRDAVSGTSFSVVSSENSVSNNDGFTAGTFHAARFGFDASDAGTNDSQWLYDIDNLVEEITSGLDLTYSGETGAVPGTIGGQGNNQSYNGEIAEIILYSDKLTDIEYIILQNYLNARYGLTTTNDFYAGDESGNGNADFGVIGIGQDASGSVTEVSQDGLRLTVDAGLENGDYVFAGYTSTTSAGNAIISYDILLNSGTVDARMQRAWYIDRTDANNSLTTDVTFDLNNSGTAIPDLSGASAGDYRLLFRAPGTSAWSVIASTATVDDGAKTITFENQTLTNDGYYSLATANSTASSIGDIRQTWYSFQSGSWGDFNSWTLDGATTPVFDNDNSETPGPGDKVVITSGKTISMYEDDAETTIQNNVSIQGINVRSSARLRLLTSTGHSFGDVSGAGTIALQGRPNTGATAYLENLPAGDYSRFADQLLGGAIELSSAASGTPLLLNQNYANTSVTTDPNGAVSRTMTLNMGLDGDRVLLQRNLYLTRNLNLTKGQLQIQRTSGTTYADDASTASDLSITVIGNTTVSATGSIRTGNSPNRRHQLNLFGNLTLNGTAHFTQLTTANTGSDATDGIVDVNFLNQETNQTLACNAVARFYRLEIDKASSAVFLNITASAVANFNLFGRANYAMGGDLGVGGTNNNAFGLVTGGISLGTNVRINTLNTGGNYTISSLATLQLDGGRILKTNGPALVPYGVFRINSGLAELLVASGITLRDAGRIEVNGGELYANAIRTSNEATEDAGSYIQTGGSVILNGGSGVGSPTTGNTGATGTNTAYYTFTMTRVDNTFRMSGGTLNIERSNYTNTTGGASEDNTDDLGGSIFVNSSVANYSVTGGSVIIDMDNGIPSKISSTAPFYNLTLTNSSGNAIADNNGGTTLVQSDDRAICFISGGQVGTGAGDATLTDQPLVVLNDLIIGNGTDPIRFDHLGNDVTVGRNFTISANAQYYMGADNLLPSNQPNGTLEVNPSHQNTTTFNGSISGTLTLDNLAGDNNFAVEQIFHNLTISKTGDSELLLTSNKGTNSDAANALRITPGGSFRVESGTFNQGTRAIRILGDVYNAGKLGVFEVGTTPTNALIKFRARDFTIESEKGAEFGNVRLNAAGNVVSINNDLIIRRLEYLHGRLNIGTHNLRVDELDIDINSSQSPGANNANFSGCGGCFSVEDMIITAGNASDGGLTLRIPASGNNPADGYSDNFYGAGPIGPINNNDFLFPIGIGTTGLDDGTSKYTPVLLSISNVGDVGADGEAFITVRPVNSKLATTNTASNAIDYYWKVTTGGFDTPPTIDYLEVFGNDDDVAGGSAAAKGNTLSNYVPGYVEDSGSFTRTSEATTIERGANPAFETTDYSITFDGGGSGLTLTDLNFTAGDPAAFTGTVEIYYSRLTNGFTGNIGNADDWDSPNTWSTVSHTGPAAGDYPQAGDIAIIRAFATSGERKVIIGIENYNPGVNLDVQVAKLIFERQNVNESGNVGNRIMIAQNASVDFGEVDGNATFQVFVSPTETTNFNNTDFGSFVDRVDEGSQFMFYGTADGISSLPAQITEYPNVRFEGNNNDAIDRFYQFPSDAVMADLFVDSRATFLVNRNITINDDLRIGGYRNGFMRFDGTNGAVTLDVKDDFLTINDGNGGDNDGNQIFVLNSNSNLIHKMKVGGNIQLGTATIANFDLHTNLTTGDNVSLELSTTAGENATWTNNSGITPELYQLVMNGGTDTNTSFSIETDFTLPAATSTFQPLEIVNGLLVLNNAAIGASGDIIIANGSDFYLPNTNNPEASSGSGGIQITAGQLSITGDDTGLILDGALILSGGDFDMSDCTNNGNNFIEYSSTGEASITINDAASILSVGSQIRRGFFSDAGILDLTMSAGNLEIGACTEGDPRRAMLEIVNPFSSFIHTGGTITFLEQNGTNASATAASLLLEPATSNLTGSNIVIDLVDANDVNFSINSLIALNNLTIQSRQGANASSEVVQIKTRPLTINGDLVMNDNVELRSNNLNLTLKGNYTLNDASFYSPGLNTTTFNVASGVTNNLNGTSTSGSFYNFSKVGTGTLALGKEITVSGATFNLTAGTINDGGNAINFTGQQLTNSATHSSSANAVNGGIRFNRAVGQQILTTATKGIFGNITIDNSDGVTTPDLSQEFRVNNQMTLADGILDIGPALLVFGQTAELTNGSDAGSEFTDFGETNQIQSNSSIIDFGIEKEFTANTTAGNFVFPVGEDNRYTPLKVDFDVTNGTSGTTDGSLRVRPRNTIAPIMISRPIGEKNSVLQYHWIINGKTLTGFTANLIANYDDDVIGSGASEDTYRAARARFTDPDLSVDNPFPDTNGNGTIEPDPDPDNTVDVTLNTIGFPIDNESGSFLSGEYFAGDPTLIPNEFSALVFDGAAGDGLYSSAGNYFFDANDDGVFNAADGDVRQTDLTSVVGGVIEIGSGQTLTLDVSNVSLSRLIIPADGILEIDGTNGHLLGQVSGTGTIRINSDGSDAPLPGGDYNSFFDCATGGGALEYGGSGSYTILTGGFGQVRSLTLSGGGEKTFINTDFSICEDLILNEGTAVFSDGKVVTVGRDVILAGATASLGSAATLEIERNLTLTSGSLTGATDGAIGLSGNLTRTGATLNLIGANATTLTFKGSTSQIITGDFSGANSLANVVVNNTAAGNAVVVSGTFGVDESMTFTDGIVLTDQTDFRTVGPTYATPNIVSFSSSATFSGGSAASFIDGVVCKENLSASTSFRFPTGDAGTFAPVQVSEDATGGSTWKARYIKRNPRADLNTRFDNLSTETDASVVEYWVVQTTSPQTAKISLEYGGQSTVLTPNETTVISLKDGNNNGIDTNDLWQDLGRGGLSAGADETGGTIDANLESTFSANFYTVAGQTATALPVELISFSATANSKGFAQLDWSTASELDNDFFEIQHSIDGITFEAVGQVEGNGTSSALHTYSFIHKQTVVGINYYRLKQVDYDGEFELSSMVYAIVEQGNERPIEFDIYPNPTFENKVTLAFDAASNEELFVLLIDQTGKIYFEQTVTGMNGEIEISPKGEAIPAGLYYVLIQHKSGKAVKKVLFK